MGNDSWNREITSSENKITTKCPGAPFSHIEYAMNDGKLYELQNILKFNCS